MPLLPDRPHLDQLRHQARELHRAAAAGDEPALRRLRAVSANATQANVTLSAAQLALAREYGFASWPRLKAGVERRRAGEAAAGGPAALSGPSQGRPALELPGRPGAAVEPVPGDASSARWEVTVTVRRGDEGFDFGGPFVRGDRTDRHLGLAWGDVPGDGTLRLSRGAKLRLVDVNPGLIEQALRPGQRLVARVRLTDARGNPICARLHPPYLTWATEPIPARQGR